MQSSRILVRATNWVGDAVMSLPALQAIRGAFPQARIAVLAKPWVADLYARESFADEVILYERSWRVVRDLRSRKFDTAILLQNAFEAAAVAFLAGIPKRIGYDRDGRGWLLTDAIAVPKPGEIPRHQRFYYLELLRRAEIIPEIPVSESIRLTGAVEAAKAGAQRFRAMGIEGPVIGVSPGAAYGTAKRWLPERFAEAASAMEGTVALFGSGSERALCEEVAVMARQFGHVAHNLAGETKLSEFIELTAACKVFLTNDSGGMHIASALGVPTLAVFGATDDEATGPTGPNALVVREPVECSPCLRRECPIDHRCMTRVTAARVAGELAQVLERQGR
jgi:heptosyltransferase-2